MRRWVALAASLGVALGFTAMSTSYADPAEDEFLGNVPMMVVVDTSGSMSESAGGMTKIEAARRAILDLVGVVSSEQDLGLMSYPGAGQVKDGCSIGEIEMKLARPDQIATSAKVRGLVPEGDTPTSPALRHAADLLKESSAASGVIVLVSDGAANCGPPVCEVAKEIRDRGISLQINTVGFDLRPDSEAARELQCVADATGGSYIPADDPDGLRNAIRRSGAAFLNLAATVPKKIPAVVGRGAEGGTRIPVTIENTGQVTAADVRVSLDFVDANKRGGALLVPRPIRFLGNLGPGDKRNLEIEVRPDSSTIGQDFTWTVAATTRDNAGGSLTGKTSVVDVVSLGLNPIFAGQGTIAIVGDSYSSGEGGGSYEADSTGERATYKDCPKDPNLPDGMQIPAKCIDKWDHKCHRSTVNYGHRLFGARARTIACSGAVTGDLFTSQKSGNARVKPQLDTLRSLALSSTPPDAVLMTLGGNDVGFPDLAKDCFLYMRCGNWLDQPASYQKWYDRIDGLGANLVRSYRVIDSAVNDSRARNNRDGKSIPIVVLPYVKIVPETNADIEGCFAGLSHDDLAFVNKFLTRLNASVKASVSTVSKKYDLPFIYAPVVTDAFQPDHTICEGKASYAVTRKFDGGRGGADIVINQDPQLLHPNAAGYQAIASAVASSTRTATLAGGKNVKRDEYTDETKFKLIVKGALTGYSLGSMHEAMAKIEVRESGLQPGSQVVIEIASSPRTIGSATVDAKGVASAQIELPDDLPPGRHHVRVVGIDETGSPMLSSQPITLLPAYTLFSVALVLLGLGLAGSSAWSLRRTRRQGNAQTG